MCKAPHSSSTSRGASLAGHVGPLLALCVYCVICIGCAHEPWRFPLEPILWDDPDRQPVASEPAEYTSGLYADAIDKTLLRPLTQAFAFPLAGEAQNVNAWDEVPDSSWFENRAGRRPFSPEQAAQGSCQGPTLDPAAGSWQISGAKTDGVTPGFFIKAPDGQRYLLKVDGRFRPQRGTTADVVGAKIYYAAGYHAPCNSIVFFKAEQLTLGAGASREDSLGRKQPLSWSDVRQVLAQAYRRADGRYRLLASRFVPGKPLGPFRYQGLRDDDPNDVVPHEHRRELRAARLLAAWLHRFDTREQNSLDAWVEEAGRHYIRHYQLDFGDALGSPWTEDRLNRRVGHAYYLDLPQVFVDFLTLGLMPRPWTFAKVNDEVEIFGHFDWERFVPSRWKPIYPNPAFSRMSWRDALWLVRIVVRLTDEHLQAIVREAQLDDPRAARYLLRALSYRRDRLAQDYLLRYVPLDRVRLSAPGADGRQQLCFEDLAIRYAGADARRVVYKVRFYAGAAFDRQLGWTQLRPAAAAASQTCTSLPLSGQRPSELAPPGAADDHPSRYAVAVIFVQQTPRQRPTSIALHMYDLGPQRGFFPVGLVRYADELPR